MEDLTADLTLALEFADLADRLTMDAQRSGDFEVTIKPDGSPVTSVDVAVEREIRDVLAARRPTDGIIGEEFGGDAAGGRQWVLDPIDGTRSFARGGTVWGTLIALEIDRRPCVGVVSMPARESRWWGAVGVGAFAVTPVRPQTTPIAVSPSGGQTPRCACVPAPETLVGDERVTADRLAASGLVVPFAEWTTYPPLMVADGSLDACLHMGAHWDVAALGAVVLAAGGAYHVGPTSHRDRTIALATTPTHESSALATLRWPPPTEPTR
ncbi:MAG TPA: inositol monophosphatase family protein [Ilumatobacteraceae bacterium]|nr:inositol monophosphatase family protein [Ilumatobacteraceae bacterium]